MPELPEVETVMRGLTPFLQDKEIAAIDARSPSLRIPIPKTKLTKICHSKITGLSRRAKYILVNFACGQTMIIHLGMTGTITVFSDSQKNKTPLDRHDHVVFTINDGVKIIYRDPRRFGLIDVVKAAEINSYKPFEKLGVEPLDKTFTAKILHERIKGRNAAIKPVLMDQSVVVGVGNIYASEALFLAGIDPRKPASSFSLKKLEVLVKKIKQILKAAIASGGSTLRDYRGVGGESGYFQFNFSVYDREGEPCPDCTCSVQRIGGIQRIVQAGRSTFFCPKKQK